MCVIMYARDVRPSPINIAKAYTANGHGGGIAWREPAKDGAVDKDGKPIIEVVWRKGLTIEEMQELALKAPLPYVLHFRIASVGQVRPSLCHPFPIAKDVPNYTSGRTRGAVLFHNGTWTDWRAETRMAVERRGMKLPEGKWSDTRAIALMCYLHGHNYMDFIEEKGIIFGPYDEDLYWGTGWYKVDDVWCSNLAFTSRWPGSTNDPTGAYGTYRSEGVHKVFKDTDAYICMEGGCQQKEGLLSDKRCPKHTRVRPNITPSDERDTFNKPMTAASTPPPLPPKQTPPASAPEVKVESSTGRNLPASKPNNTPLPGAENAGAGGHQTDSPFVQWQNAQRAFSQGAISRNAFKRARKAYEKWQYQEERKRAKDRAGLLPSEPPVVAKNLNTSVH